jgi:hypothetical protein
MVHRLYQKRKGIAREPNFHFASEDLPMHLLLGVGMLVLQKPSWRKMDINSEVRAFNWRVPNPDSGNSGQG